MPLKRQRLALGHRPVPYHAVSIKEQRVPARHLSYVWSRPQPVLRVTSLPDNTVSIKERCVPARHIYLLAVEVTASVACHISLQFNLGAEACSSSSTETLGFLEPKKKNTQQHTKAARSPIANLCHQADTAGRLYAPPPETPYCRYWVLAYMGQ